MRKPEILSPAGDIECIKAAFAAGANAVYFGLPFFNARQRAKNIDPKQLPSIVSEAKLRGIKLYLTLNTLITEGEIPLVLDVIDTAMISGITDFIIQDMGILYIFKKNYPMAKIHISTQATTHTKGQITFFSRHNITRINLARELSLSEIKELTDLAHKNNMETEVFVHGSYCISYSGQCYLCSFLEG
ncbi:MAG: U32 family peptidase, partial [Spirochaetaceae bacterium]|nr:U32 family peptidase [Spirochaetaceae bacterium]